MNDDVGGKIQKNPMHFSTHRASITIGLLQIYHKSL